MARHSGKCPTNEPKARARLAYLVAGPAGRHRNCIIKIKNNPMKSPFFNTTVLFYPNKNPKLRLFALWYFTVLMIVWNVLGHTVLGFEQSWATPVVGVSTCILVSMILDWVDAQAKNRELRFAGGWKNFANFLPASIIPGL